MCKKASVFRGFCYIISNTISHLSIEPEQNIFFNQMLYEQWTNFSLMKKYVEQFELIVSKR